MMWCIIGVVEMAILVGVLIAVHFLHWQRLWLKLLYRDLLGRLIVIECKQVVDLQTVEWIVHKVHGCVLLLMVSLHGRAGRFADFGGRRCP